VNDTDRLHEALVIPVLMHRSRGEDPLWESIEAFYKKSVMNMKGKYGQQKCLGLQLKS